MLKKLFSRGKTQEKSYDYMSLSGNPFIEQVFYGGRVTSSKSASFYRHASAVAIAVDTIAREIENIVPVVELSDGTLDDTHPVLELLANPNEFEDYREFMGQMARNYLLNHDCFVYGEGSVNRPPINMFCLNNQNVSITQDATDRYPLSYSVNTGFGVGKYQRDKRGRRLSFYDGNLKQLYHIHGYSSRTDNTYADSPLEAAALETRQQILGKNHNLKIIDNGGRLSMAVIIKGDNPPTQEQFDAIEQKAYEKFSGSSNAGRIAVFGASDMDIKEMGQSAKDMDFANMDKISRDAIYMRYGVPLPLVSPERQTFNNFDRAIEDLYDRAVLPYAKVLFSGLTKMLKPRYRDSFEAITYNPEYINALKSRMLAELKVRREINIETVNEMREGLPNREPLEGGDIFYQSATLIPAGEDVFQQEEVNPDAAIRD